MGHLKKWPWGWRYLWLGGSVGNGRPGVKHGRLSAAFPCKVRIARRKRGEFAYNLRLLAVFRM